MTDVAPTLTMKTVPKPRDQHLRDMADCIRFLSMDAVQQANSGWSGFEIQEIDHRERCHYQANAPDQHVAHRGSALRAPRLDCGLDYVSVFLLRHFFLPGS
jgi:hypothetical protein